MLVKLTMLGSVYMNDENTLNELKKQHFNNYKNAIIELIKNNSNVLFDEDISSLINKPPLDSMDIIKNKFLDIAKKEKIVLNDENYNKIIESFRKDLFKFALKFKKERNDFLIKIVDDFKQSNDFDLIKINKKDFNSLNSKIKKSIKSKLIDLSEEKIVNNVNNLFTKDCDKEVINKVSLNIKKYLKSTYEKQLLENIDFKVLVKDTTLINLIKEQGERYMFTQKNSHIFN